MELKERNQKIAEKFKAIRDIADTYLNLRYPDAPDPDQFMADIDKKLVEYGELIQPREAIAEVSRLLEEHGYEHREGVNSLMGMEYHHFIMGTILIQMIVTEHADEKTLESIRNVGKHGESR